MTCPVSRSWYARDTRSAKTLELIGTREQVRLAAAELMGVGPERVHLSPAPDWGGSAKNYS